ncbi:hypothetical protein pqer_cds_31 [Pandoravirus quercus]|uniref:Uncharacterized protein n=1 Tax=Pandoravirus quercus TaxID=2107709 RepID=A0A2U7U7Q4_9VIRU|nr:hypothetical protein pqer_cds_31 [Pandoravirus quercus]AVK74453.1 hypothetical protein pqer_cds_31 [Pandoravirus quercus]
MPHSPSGLASVSDAPAEGDEVCMSLASSPECLLMDPHAKAEKGAPLHGQRRRIAPFGLEQTARKWPASSPNRLLMLGQSRPPVCVDRGGRPKDDPMVVAPTAKRERRAYASLTHQTKQKNKRRFQRKKKKSQ